MRVRVWARLARGAALVGALATAGCAPPIAKGDVPVEVLTSAPGQVPALEVRTLEGVVDLHAFHGGHVRLLGGGILNTLPLNNASGYIDGDFRASVRAMREATFSASAPPRGALFFADDAWRTDTFDALLQLTVLYNFEQVRAFAHDVVKDPSGATQTPGVVGVHTELRTSVLPGSIAVDNAFYVAGADVWIVGPPAATGGVPFAMNPGIVAHEYHHRVFFHTLWAGSALWTWADVISRTAAQDDPAADALQFQRNTLRALDEGLADVFALGFAGTPAFLDASLLSDEVGAAGDVFRAEAERRSVEGAFADAATYEALRDDTMEFAFLNACGGRSEGFTARPDVPLGPSWNPYCLGTVVARALWDMSGRDMQVYRTAVLPAVNAGLRRANETIRENHAFDFETTLGHIFAAVERAGVDVCPVAQARFATFTTANRWELSCPAP